MKATFEKAFISAILSIASFCAYMYMAVATMVGAEKAIGDETTEDFLAKVLLTGAIALALTLGIKFVQLFSDETTPESINKVAIFGALAIPILYIAGIYLGVIVLIGMLIYTGVKSLF